MEGERRKKEDGRRRGKRGARPSPVEMKLKRGKREREEGLKKTPSMEGQAAMGQTRRLGDFLIKCLLEWALN